MSGYNCEKKDDRLNKRIDTLRTNHNIKFRDLQSQVDQLRRECKSGNGGPIGPLEMSGNGVYLSLADRTLKEKAEEHVKVGKGVIRLILKSYAWLPGLENPFKKDPATGLYLIDEFNPEWSKWAKEAMLYANSLGVKLLLSFFDTVSEEQPERWARNVFNAMINMYNECQEGVPYSECNHIDRKNKVEHGQKGDCGPDSVAMQVLFKAFYINLLDLLPPGNYIENNELETRTGSKIFSELAHQHLVAKGLRPLYKLSEGGTFMWGNGSYIDKKTGLKVWWGPDYNLHLPSNIANDEMWGWMDCVSVHHVTCERKDYKVIDEATGIVHEMNQSRVERYYEYYKPLRDKDKTFILDTDGHGRKPIRGENGRHTLEAERATKLECMETFGEHFEMFISKVLSEADHYNVLRVV